MDQLTSAKAEFLASTLQHGERYAGIILGKNGEPDYHLILLPGRTAPNADAPVAWEQAKEFAAHAGGELPTRREQALLYANLKEEFEERAYWSCEQHAAYSDFAWCQHFDYGYQGITRKSVQLRARAVRRVAITSALEAYVASRMAELQNNYLGHILDRELISELTTRLGIEPIGYVRKYAPDCLKGTQENKKQKSSTRIDPFQVADDDIQLYLFPPSPANQEE